jgi:hypothetical protein
MYTHEKDNNCPYRILQFLRLQERQIIGDRLQAVTTIQ